jgi:hypothetical protein
MFRTILNWLLKPADRVSAVLYRPYSYYVLAPVTAAVFIQRLRYIWLVVLLPAGYVLSFSLRSTFSKTVIASFQSGGFVNPYRLGAISQEYLQMHTALQGVTALPLPPDTISYSGWYLAGAAFAAGGVLAALSLVAWVYRNELLDAFVNAATPLTVDQVPPERLVEVKEEVKNVLNKSTWERAPEVTLVDVYKPGCALKLEDPMVLHTTHRTPNVVSTDTEIYYKKAEWIPLGIDHELTVNGITHRIPAPNSLANAENITRALDALPPFGVPKAPAWVNQNKMEIDTPIIDVAAQLPGKTTTYVFLAPDKVTQLVDVAIEGEGNNLFAVPSPRWGATLFVEVFKVVAWSATGMLGSVLADFWADYQYVSLRAVMIGVVAGVGLGYAILSPAGEEVRAALPITLAALLPSISSFIGQCDQTTTALILAAFQVILPANLCWLAAMTPEQIVLVEAFFHAMDVVEGLGPTSYEAEVNRLFENSPTPNKLGLFMVLTAFYRRNQVVLTRLLYAFIAVAVIVFLLVCFDNELSRLVTAIKSIALIREVVEKAKKMKEKWERPEAPTESESPGPASTTPQSSFLWHPLRWVRERWRQIHGKNGKGGSAPLPLCLSLFFTKNYVYPNFFWTRVYVLFVVDSRGVARGPARGICRCGCDRGFCYSLSRCAADSFLPRFLLFLLSSASASY